MFWSFFDEGHVFLGLRVEFQKRAGVGGSDCTEKRIALVLFRTCNIGQQENPFGNRIRYRVQTFNFRVDRLELARNHNCKEIDVEHLGVIGGKTFEVRRRTKSVKFRASTRNYSEVDTPSLSVVDDVLHAYENKFTFRADKTSTSQPDRSIFII